MTGNIFIIGTRAQLIKVAPIILACERHGLHCPILMTGQHHETMQELVSEFDIRSTIRMATDALERSTVFSLITWLPKAYKGTLRKLRNMVSDYKDGGVNVLVHGDTLTTLLSAFCARKLGLRVIHLESGLTSGKILSPFPEELIRRMVFRMTDVAICPDDTSMRHMQRISSAIVFNSNGNSIIDAAEYSLQQAGHKAPETRAPYLLFSIHRFHNIYNNKRLTQLVDLIVKLSAEFEIFFILHPSTKKRLNRTGLIDRLLNIDTVYLSDRMPYGDFIRLAGNAECVLTDGGSNQEELAFLGIPTIVMREHTERQDGMNQNAVMEGNLHAGVFAFLQNREYKNLRKDRLVSKVKSPSESIARFIKNLPEADNAPF